jgi:hypothetical protein
MICPKCKGTIGYGKEEQFTENIELKDKTTDMALESISDEHFFSSDDGIMIKCGFCDTEMEEE